MMPVSGPRSNMSACQERHHRQDRDHCDILEQQHRESILASGSFHQPFFVQGLQHNRRRGERQGQPKRQSGLPGQSESNSRTEDQRTGQTNLQPTQAKDRHTQLPEQGRLQFQADQKQHHHHPEFGKMHHVLPFLPHQAQGKRSDDDAGDQISQHRAQAEPLGHRHRDNGCAEINKCLIKKSAFVHGSISCF